MRSNQAPWGEWVPSEGDRERWIKTERSLTNWAHCTHELSVCDRCGYQHDPADGDLPTDCKCANSPRWMRATLVIWERA